MTYKDLLQELLDMKKLTPERLDDTVTVFEPYEDEFIPVVSVGFASEANDVLDPDHFYLVLKA